VFLDPTPNWPAAVAVFLQICIHEHMDLRVVVSSLCSRLLPVSDSSPCMYYVKAWFACGLQPPTSVSVVVEFLRQPFLHDAGLETPKEKVLQSARASFRQTLRSPLVLGPGDKSL